MPNANEPLSFLNVLSNISDSLLCFLEKYSSKCAMTSESVSDENLCDFLDRKVLISSKF